MTRASAWFVGLTAAAIYSLFAVAPAAAHGGPPFVPHVPPPHPVVAPVPHGAHVPPHPLAMRPAPHSHLSHTRPATAPRGEDVAAHLASSPKLAQRLTTLLPSGTTLQTATAGFKTLGQFVAAVEVSHNLGIPFDQLKTRITGQHPESLGQAVEALRPGTTNKQIKQAEKLPPAPTPGSGTSTRGGN